MTFFALRGLRAGLTLAVLAAEPLAAQIVVPPDGNGVTHPSIATSLPHNGDPAGIRKSLSDRGITYNLIYTNDVLSNLSGGTKRGTIDQGKVEGQLTVNLEKLAGWRDLTLYANAFQIDNTGRFRRDYIGGMNTIAAIEANTATRLSELWLERKFFDGAASFRIGQLAADNEFFFSDLSNMFMQTDWPTIAAANIPGGGPAYPLSTPGARVKFDHGKDVSFLLALFNGDPAGPCAGDPDTCNRYGLNFRVRDPAFIIGEAQFRSNQAKDDRGLARTLKLGGWTHLGQFNDQRFANDGTLLANPAGSGMPAQHRGDFGVYGIIDQQLYRPRRAAADGGISVFGLASVSPSDRNLVDLQLNGGLIFAGFVPHRPDDRFGASVVYSRFSGSVGAFDQDAINFTGAPGPVRDYEANLELSYVAHIVPGWTVQPDFQYVWHPSGVAGRDAKILGIRTMLKF
ncbi:MAG: carbohydrate porin [Pseudolabrys sp.]